MKYRTDHIAGNELSILGFGCMRFPRSGATTDKAATERILLKAIDKGVNYFDTAYVYGNSEEILGEILHKNNVRDKIYIATKLPYQKCKQHSDFDRLFNEQLKRLKTDHIDYYLIHNISDPPLWENLKKMGIARWIEEKKAAGQISNIGYSFHGTQEGFLQLLDDYEWDFCQIQYNYMNENYQAGRVGLERAHAKGLAVIIMEPLLGGKLANGLPREAVGVFKNASADHVVPAKDLSAEDDSSGKSPSVTGNLSPAAWALMWVWNHKEATLLLSGMNSDEQLEENLRIAEMSEAGMFTDEETTVFAPARAAIEKSYKVPCTGCNYCMPCPKRVNIPGAFTAYNISYAIGFMPGMTNYFTSIASLKAKDNFSPRNCVHCGQCVSKCPQHIAIPDELDHVVRRLEPWWVRIIMKIIARVMS